MSGQAQLSEWRPGQYRLRFESSQEGSGLIYALTYKVFRYLEGNIFGLTAHAVRGRTYVSVYHSLPASLLWKDAQAITAEHF